VSLMWYTQQSLQNTKASSCALLLAHPVHVPHLHIRQKSASLEEYQT
jgi:hypothetical protein